MASPVLATTPPKRNAQALGLDELARAEKVPPPGPVRGPRKIPASDPRRDIPPRRINGMRLGAPHGFLIKNQDRLARLVPVRIRPARRPGMAASSIELWQAEGVDGGSAGRDIMANIQPQTWVTDAQSVNVGKCSNESELNDYYHQPWIDGERGDSGKRRSISAGPAAWQLRGVFKPQTVSSINRSLQRHVARRFNPRSSAERRLKHCATPAMLPACSTGQFENTPQCEDPTAPYERGPQLSLRGGYIRRAGSNLRTAAQTAWDASSPRA